tara:strand:- start:2051 stop:3136 length:1086 start_codon:yes stop_codon:yes gene_type:complete
MASRQPHFGGGFGDDRGDEFVVQDLHDGLNEWRNIQDIVRLSFVAFHKALQAQGDAIFALTEETERRALKSDVRLGFETHEELLNVRVRELKADAEAKHAVGVGLETAAIDDLRRRVDAAETRMDGFASKADLQTASDDTKRALDSMLRELRGETPQGGDQGGDTVKALAERMETIAVTYATKKELANASASLQNKQVHSSAVNVLEKSKSVSVEEVNRALAEVSAALDTKANGEALEGFVLSTQAALRGIVHESALCVGRWIWKSGITHKPHGAVPWNVESLNTDPSNFGWDRDDTVIHTAAPGLYEVTFGFFTRYGLGAFLNPADCLPPLFDYLLCTTGNSYQYWQLLQIYHKQIVRPD